MMEVSPFYLVWCPTRQSPTVQHSLFGGAEAEAKRLARANPGEAFFVTAAIARIEKIDVGVTRYTIDPDQHPIGCGCDDCVPF